MPEPRMPDGNTAALRDYMRREDGLTLGEDEDVCEGPCGQVVERGDLYYSEDGDHPRCGKCIMRGQTEYAVMTTMLRQAAAMLGTPEKSVTAHGLANRILNWLDR